MSDERETPAAVDVAIVGGGAAGVLVALRLLADPASSLRVALVDPAPEPGGGAAYATAQVTHLLNVPAGRMSAFQDDPDHFVRYLVAHGHGDAETLAAAFMPRRVYGRYLLDTLRAQPGFEALRVLRDRVVGIDVMPSGQRLRLAAGGQLDARHVVLAVGNRPRPLPASIVRGEVPVVEAWDDGAVAAIPENADVCIVGSGLSMVDAVLCLAERHRGHLRAVSRHGLLPLPHAAKGPVGAPPTGLDAPSLRARFRALRAATQAATAAGEPWQWVFDRLRPRVQALWTSLPHAEQQRFLRHAVRYWDVHRHRIAPVAAATLATLQASGRLQVQAARLQGMVLREDGRIDVTVQPRHAAAPEQFTVDCVINATGIDPTIDPRPDRLLGQLQAKGRIVAGPHGLGVSVAADGRVVDAAGRTDPALFVIGALRMGQLWETTAIHELREQARDIAAAIASPQGEARLG